MMSTKQSYAFQSPSVFAEKGAPRMRAPRTTRSNLRHFSDASSRAYTHIPYRRTRRLALLVVFLAFCTVACFACAYWLFATRYDGLSYFRTTLEKNDAAPLLPGAPSLDPLTPHSFDIDLDITRDSALDERNERLDALRADPAATYLAYLPHSGLHNQRIALENALTLARLLNRTLLVPPARLGPKTLRYVRSGTLAHMLRLSDKRHGRLHCAHLLPHVSLPDECADYTTYTLVPWAWLVDMRPIAVHQTFVRTSNATAEWIEQRLGISANETRVLPDAAPYEHQFVDTSAPPREGDKYLGMIEIDMLAVVPERLVQLGTLFGSSRLRLRKAENRLVRGDVRKQMIFGNAELTLAAKRVEDVLGETYVAAHVRVGDGRFQRGARENVRLTWWKLIRDVMGLDTETALGLENHVLPKMSEEMTTDSKGQDDDDENENDSGNSGVGSEADMLKPPETQADAPSLRVPHPPLAPLPDALRPKLSCRSQLHTTPSLRRLNVPLFIATDAPDGLDDLLLAPFVRAFPCTFVLGSFKAEMKHLEGLRNGYDGVSLGMYLTPIVDALVMGRAWAVVGTEGSTFSRYVADVLWRVSHGWEIVQRG